MSSLQTAEPAAGGEPGRAIAARMADAGQALDVDGGLVFS